MDEKHLCRWLSDADSSLRRTTTTPVDLGARLRATAAQREVLKVAAVGLMAVAGVAVAAWLAAAWHLTERPLATVEPVRPVAITEIPTGLRELADAARAVRLLEEAVESCRVRDAVKQAYGQVDDVSAVDRAAATMLAVADRKRRDPFTAAAAEQEFSRVAALFPNTFWAETAHTRMMGDSPR